MKYITVNRITDRPRPHENKEEMVKHIKNNPREEYDIWFENKRGDYEFDGYTAPTEDGPFVVNSQFTARNLTPIEEY